MSSTAHAHNPIVEQGIPSPEEIRGALDQLARLKEWITSEEQRLTDILAKLQDLEGWKAITAPSPCPSDARPILWLSKRLDQVKAKHPTFTWSFVKDEAGRITAIRFKAENDEVAQDAQGPITWAFRAAVRPRAEEP